MSFYQELSRYYDEIFAASPEDMAWLNSRLTGRPHLLDIGCGTGNKTELLAGPGREIIGLDSDPAMIELAQKNHAGPGLSYQVGDMTALAEAFPAGGFDGLLCLGNTLAHLLDPARLEAFGRGAAELLAPGGLLAIQILNYDWLASQQIRELPLIETEHTVFRRFYVWGQTGDSLRFQTRLEIKGGETLCNDIPLRPIYRNELSAALGRDFDQIEFFGGYDGRPLVPDSFVLMCLARRAA